VIALTGKPGDLNSHVRFTPRPGFKKTHKVIERELVYGHYCPRCTNVVQALFLTDELPKTATSKVAKRELRAQLTADTSPLTKLY